jgi:hypothetical protein
MQDPSYLHQFNVAALLYVIYLSHYSHVVSKGRMYSNWFVHGGSRKQIAGDEGVDTLIPVILTHGLRHQPQPIPNVVFVWA